MTSWKEWVPEQAIEELTLKRALQDVEDPSKLAAELFKDALPVAVMRMTHLALHEQNPVVAFNASKYVIDRNMGSVQSPTKPDSEVPAWQKIFDSIAEVADKT
jgi:hypothetical protein